MQRVGDLLRAFLAGRLSPEADRVIELVAAWRELAGQAGEHVRVRDIRGGVLVVEADHPGWGQLVSMRKRELLRSLERRFPEMALSELRIVASAAERPPAEGTDRESRRRGLPDGEGGAAAMTGAQDELDKALSGVADEGLRRALRSLYDNLSDSREPRAEG